MQTIRGEVERCRDNLEKSNRKAGILEEELTAEKASLQDCPQVFIELKEYDTQKAVAVHNVSQTVDAFDIQMTPVNGQDVRLVAEAIHHLKAGETKRLELSTSRKVLRAGLPDLPAKSDVRVFFEEAADGNPFSSASVTVNYRDVTSTKRCASTADITWYIWPTNHLAHVKFGKMFRVVR